MNQPPININNLGLVSYKDKIPNLVYAAMHSFTQSDVVLVPIHKPGKTVTNNRNHSHKNVDEWIESMGGYRVSGWTLDRNKKQLNDGIFVWKFHSDWLTNDGKLLNVTIDTRHVNLDKHTFWHDAHRYADLHEGYTFNDVFITTNQNIAMRFKIEANKLYWFAGGYFKPIEEFDGKCFWLQQEYPNNFDKLEKEWGVKLVKTEKGFAPTQSKAPNDLDKDAHALNILFRFSLKNTPNSSD